MFKQLFKKKPETKLPYPSVEEWLTHPRKELEKLASEVDKTCFTCYWLQFREGGPTNNRVCQYPDVLKVRFIARGVAKCRCWRVDPKAKTREQGLTGFIA
jgi:hypothetical protein